MHNKLTTKVGVVGSRDQYLKVGFSQ